jgi:hypothetical protein
LVSKLEDEEEVEGRGRGGDGDGDGGESLSPLLSSRAWRCGAVRCGAVRGRRITITRSCGAKRFVP